jgi:hypothetical protein
MGVSWGASLMGFPEPLPNFIPTANVRQLKRAFIFDFVETAHFGERDFVNGGLPSAARLQSENHRSKHENELKGLSHG